MGKHSPNDLGKERIGKLLLRLALPAIAAQLVNMLYNIVDRMYIGHIPDVGAAALTGVGVSFPIIMIISAFSALIGMGGAPHASIKMGQGDNEAAERILGNCFTVLLAISVVLTAFFLLTGEKLLLLFGASESTVGYGLGYLNIYVCGTVFVQLALGLNSFISSQGFATRSMLTVVIGAVINIVLDPLFIFAFGLGERGAALATVLSQAVSAIWVLKFLTGKKTALRIRRKNLRVRRSVILPVLMLGVSPFIMQSTESLVSVCLNS
ncbi:MATE domain protein, partial [[Clostridium] methylpentosum DSM 5476]